MPGSIGISAARAKNTVRIDAITSGSEKLRANRRPDS